MARVLMLVVNDRLEGHFAPVPSLTSRGQGSTSCPTLDAKVTPDQQTRGLVVRR